MRTIIVIILLFHSAMAFSQPKMRPLDELINRADPGWVIVKAWIDSAKNLIEILQTDTLLSKEELYKTQVTTRSPMGAIIYKTGGLLVDNGWIRILGSGNSKLKRSLPEWNKGKSYKDFGEAPTYLLVADDVIGGFFFLNGGALGKDLGKVYYFSPDNLDYEPMNLTYSEFLQFCFNNNLDEFYKGYRWEHWQDDVSKISGDQAFNFFPPLFTKEGKDIKKSSRKTIPVVEQYNYQMDMRRQLGNSLKSND